MASLALLNWRRTVAFWLFSLPCRLPKRNSVRHIGPRSIGGIPRPREGECVIMVLFDQLG
jgi:hypothetical protein